MPYDDATLPRTTAKVVDALVVDDEVCALVISCGARVAEAGKRWRLMSQTTCKTAGRERSAEAAVVLGQEQDILQRGNRGMGWMKMSKSDANRGLVCVGRVVLCRLF